MDPDLLEPADMTISPAEADAARRASESHGAHPPAGHQAPRSLADAHRSGGHGHPSGHADPGGNNHGGEHGEHGGHEDGFMHWVHRGMHAVEGLHTMAEAVHLNSLPGATFAEHTAEVVEHASHGPSGALGTASRVLGPLGAMLGVHQAYEGFENNNPVDVLQGAVGATGGVASTLATTAGVAGAAPVAAVAAAGAAGMAFGHEVVDPAVGGLIGINSRSQMTPEMERQNTHDYARLQGGFGGRREEALRGIRRGADGNPDAHASSHMVDRHDNLSDRMAEFASGGNSTGVVSDEEIDQQYRNGQFGRDLATYLPQIAGGDVPTGDLRELYRRQNGLMLRTGLGAVDAGRGLWNRATSLFD